MKVQYCEWDSQFFGKKIGQLFYYSAFEAEMIQLLEESKAEGYQLIYVFGNENLYFEKPLLEQFNGHLADQKCLYSKTISDLDSSRSIAREYEGSDLTKDFTTLACLSGTYSRFHLDNGFDKEDFYHLYSIWITRSLKKEIADKIFVVTESEKIMGMVTLKITDNVGRIGLFAVSETTQGKGYGSSLINACVNDLLSKHIYQLEVPTQMENTVACRFYEKSGFSIQTITNIYHFWL